MRLGKRKIALIGGLLILACAIAIVITEKFPGGENREKKKISMIVYGTDPQRWENLRQGAEQICEANGAELTIIHMESENDGTEQIDLIRREVEGGVDGLLIAAADSNMLGEYFDNRKMSVPVVFVENGVASKNPPLCISANDYQMGRRLGEELVNRENPIVKVAIISDGLDRESVRQREKGFREVVEPYANQVITWKRYEDEKNLITRKFIQRGLLEEAVDVVVALDNNTTDALMDALDNLNRKTKVYAISTSEKAVYNLDLSKIKALEYQAEFSMGYIAAQYLLGEEKGTFDTDSILYRVIHKDNMYEKDNQKLIFPFVQ